MHLICLLEHMKGESVLVGGSQYAVDANGEAFIANPEDARALLANVSGWALKPTPLMPTGADGLPEHIVIPEQYTAAPDVVQDISAQDRVALESPIFVSTADAVPVGDYAPAEGASAATQPIAGVDFSGHRVTEADVIRQAQADEAPRPVRVSAPTSAPDAKLGSHNHPKKGRRK